LIVGGFVQWLFDARLTLTLRQIFGWTDYLNDVSIPGQRTNIVNRKRRHGGYHQDPVDETELITYSRNDDIWSTEISATRYFTADIQADLSVLYRDVASTDDFESFQEYGGSARIGWLHSSGLEIFLSGFWSRLDYENAPQDIARGDDYYGFGVGTNREMGKIMLYIRFDQTVNDSPVDGENYTKAVAQCGIVYSF
jgi:hypothetical protein